MKKIILAIILVFIFGNIHAQNTDKDFLQVYQRISTQRIFNLDRSDEDKFKKDSLEVVEIQQLLDFYNSYMNEEHGLNGQGGFSFSGNENETNNLYKIGVNGTIDKGAYPYELDFNLGVKTTIQDGDFREKLSDINISYDFHPHVPKSMAKGDGLWLENYVFMKRFNNNFLGIEQRYEVGFGAVFNFFSRNRLTASGKGNEEKLEKMPHYEVYEGDLKRCLEECYLKESVLNITEGEISAIVDAKERYKRSNIKKHSKLRIGLLVGVYYEVEKAVAKNELYFNGRDTTVTESFEGTNKLRWELRPTMVFRPKDRYKLKVYPYFKMPFGRGKNTVSQGLLTDGRYDYFIDLQASFHIQVEKTFAISLDYRMLYDNAPKRKYLEQGDGTYALLIGQKKHNHYGMSLKFQL